MSLIKIFTFLISSAAAIALAASQQCPEGNVQWNEKCQLLESASAELQKQFESVAHYASGTSAVQLKPLVSTILNLLKNNLKPVNTEKLFKPVKIEVANDRLAVGVSLNFEGILRFGNPPPAAAGTDAASAMFEKFFLANGVTAQGITAPIFAALGANLEVFKRGIALIQNSEVQAKSSPVTMWRIYAPTNMLSNISSIHTLKYETKCEVSMNPAAADVNSLIAAIKSCDTTGAVVR